MPHIAIDARIISSSTGRYVERLVTYLQDVDKENQYTILVREKDKDYWKPRNANFSVVVAEYDQFSFAEQLGFLRFLNKLGADLVHFGIVQQPILYRGKKVTTFHDMTLVKTYNSDKNWFVYHAKQFVGRFAFRSIAKTNDHIIAISEFTKKELVEFTNIPEDKVTVVYEASDISDDGTQKYSLPFKKFLLYVGAQSDYKNIRRLGDAHQLLLEKYPDIGLVLVGKKTPAHLRNEAYFEKRGYKNILFTDFVSDKQLNWFYKNATAYTFPSLMEGFGLPPLEAMGNGLPVVSSNATCLPEIYGDAAYYFNPYDIQDIAKAITTVLNDEKLRVRLVKAGFKRLKKYSWKKQARETLAIYKKILKT